MSSLKSRDSKHVFRSWTKQKRLNPVALAGGQGASFWDDNDKVFLDFSSQMVNLNMGHQHPMIIDAMKEQLEKFATCSQVYTTEVRVKAATMIAERTPGDLNKIFFTNAGSDAVEHALRIARVVTGRQKVMSMHKSYHGATAGTLSVTGDPRRWHAEPGVPGVVRFFGPYLYRSSFYSESAEQECERAIFHIEELVKYEGPDSIAAILVEPIVGSNGILVPPEGYLPKIRQICDRHGIMLICDEVMSGFGRAGHWFAINKWSVEPDLIAFAKGVNSGYVPLGGVAISEQVASYFDERYFAGGGTYYGHPLACAAAIGSMKAFESENILGNSRNHGERVIGPKLLEMKKRHPSIGDIRGTALFWGIELVQDNLNKMPFLTYGESPKSDNPLSLIKKKCAEHGVSILISMNVLFITPPLIISEEDLIRGLNVIDEALFISDQNMKG